MNARGLLCAREERYTGFLDAILNFISKLTMRSIKSRAICYFAITVTVLVVLTIYHSCDLIGRRKGSVTSSFSATELRATVAEWPALSRQEESAPLMEKVCKGEVRDKERQNCVQLLLSRLVVATGFSSNHYYRGLNMIASVQKMMPEVKIIVYDLGMTSLQRNTVLDLCGVQIRNFNFSKYPEHVRDLFKYAWKPIVAHELVKDYEVVMWGDASVRLLKPLQEYILPYLLDIEVPFVGTKYNAPIVRMTHNGTLNYFNATRESMQDLPTLQGGCWVLWLTEKTKRLLNSWVDCALHEECIAPNGTHVCNCNLKIWNMNVPQEVGYCGCHRFDQSALNVILTREFGKEVFKTVFENSNTFEIKYAYSSNSSEKYCYSGTY